MLKKYTQNKQGQGMSEYLILVLLISVGAIAAAKGVGSTIYAKLGTIQAKISGVNFGEVGKKDSAGSGDIKDKAADLAENFIEKRVDSVVDKLGKKADSFLGNLLGN